MDKSILVYPNPSNQDVNILSPSINIESIQLYDVNQKLIKYYNSISAKRFKLKTTNLAKGIYFMQIQDINNNIKNHKLIIY